MITLHESNITSFPHDNGIGVLKDVIRAYAEEELNGLFEFYMEYDSEGHLVNELKEERIIKAKAQDKLGYQLFRIYSITKNHDNDNLIVRAQHITYDLADNFVEKLEANNLTKKQVMELIGSSTVLPHPFNVTSSNTTTRSSTRIYRTNPLQMIGGIEGSVLQIWGGQIERDNFNLILHDRRGSDDGVKVTYEKNITGLEATFDISGLVTRIFPFVYIEATDNEPSRLITVNGKYIDSPHINDYEKIYIKPIDYSNDERINMDGTDAQIRQQLTNIASQYFKETGNDKIKVDMEVQFEHLWETEEYKHLAVLELVGMGDTVTIEHSRLKVDATAIVNYIRYDCIAEKNEEVRLGSVKARLTDNVNRVVDVAEKVEQAQQTANQAIRAANGKNTIYYGPDEPEGGIEGDLWFRVVDGEYTRTYRHDGIQWQLVLSVDVRDAMDEAQQAKDEAQQAVERANQATQQATNAINQAQTAFDEAQNALVTASNAMTQATSAFSLANDAFNEVESLSTIVDENTGEISTIKQSVIGLQTRVSDNEGNISNLTQIAQGLQSQVSDIEGNVTTLTQTAQGLQSTVTNLQNELDGLEISGRNLLYNSAFNNGLDGWAHNGTSTIELTPEGYLKNTFTEARSTPGIRLLYNKLNLEKGTYTLTLKVDTSNLASIAFFRMYLIGDSSGSFYIDIPRTNGMEIVSVTFDIPEDRKNDTFYILTNNSLTVGDFIVYDWLVLMRGNKRVSDWTPAPEDIDHQFSVITQTIDGITTRVGDAEGNITALQQTANSLAGRLSDAEGNITTLTATVNGLQTTVTNVQGDVSSVTQLANALQTRMTNAEGNISTLTQTASSLQSTVSSLQDELDGLEIGGRNLLRNSHFNGLSYWVGNLTATLTIENGYLKVIFGQSQSTPGLRYFPQITLDKGFYTASAKVNVENLSKPLTFYVLPNYRGTQVLEGGETGWRIITWTFEVTANQDTGIFYLLSQNTSSTDYMLVEWIKLEKGNRATDWTPAVEDMATQSQITQLSDAINLRVMKGDVINQINISDESILIDGKRIHITGQTTIDDASIDGAKIKDASIGNAQIGYIDAAKINSGELNTNNITIRGGNATEYTYIQGSTIVSQGRFTRTWKGKTTTSDVNVRLRHGYLRFRDEQASQSLYISSFGISTFMDGEGEYLDLPGSSGTIEWWDTTYSPSNAKGITMSSYSGVVALRSDTSHVTLDSYQSVDIYSRNSVVYVSPKTDVYSGNNNFWFNLIDGTDDGFLMYGSRATQPGVGLRFSKSSSVNTISVVDSNYTRGGNTTFDVGTVRTNNIYKRESNTSVYWNGTSGGDTRVEVGGDSTLRASGIRAISGTSDIFLATNDGAVRVTDGRGYNGGNINYRPIAASNFAQLSSIKTKTNIVELADVGLEVINSLVVYEYDLINNPDLGRQVGLISEYSEIVAMEDNTAIDLYKLTSYNTKAIQELDMKFTNLEDEVNWLKIENQYLKQKIEQLEEMIA